MNVNKLVKKILTVICRLIYDWISNTKFKNMCINNDLTKERPLLIVVFFMGWSKFLAFIIIGITFSFGSNAVFFLQ